MLMFIKLNIASCCGLGGRTVAVAVYLGRSTRLITIAISVTTSKVFSTK
jgi:hypothetical protein